MEKFKYILFFLVVLSFSPVWGHHLPNNNEDKIRSRVLNMYHIVDVRYNEEVAFYINLYTNRHRSLMSDILGRAELFFPYIDQYSAKYNLPYELRYLPIIESALKPAAISRSKAVGFWQIMHRLGSYYQLRMDDWVDERCDLFKSSETAMMYLTELYDQFEDWTLALAAYNCGPGRMRKAIRESGSRDFWELKAYLPKETQRYIPKFIAFNYLMHYHHEHDIQQNLPFDQHDPVLEYTIIFDELSFEDIEKMSGMNPELLQLLNAAYKKKLIPSNSEGYILSLPSDVMDRFMENYHQLEEPDSIFGGVYPRYGVIPKYKVQQSGYTVRSGDNLYNLAKRFDCRITDLKNWNYLKNDRIYPGQRLSVVCKAIDLVPIQRSRKILDDVPAVGAMEIHNTISSPKIAISTQVEYTDHLRPKSPIQYFLVEDLISISEIAEQFSNIEVEDLIILNEFSENVKLLPGSRVKIGKAKEVSAVTKNTEIFRG